MIFADVHDFLKHLEKGKRIMGIDFGERNVGLAFSDRNHMITSPHSVYKRRNIKKDLGYLNWLFKQQDCTGIVMGFPENTDVKDKHWTTKISTFTKKLSHKYSINIYLQDESLTTQEAREILAQLSIHTEKRIQKIDDKIAASCILDRTLNIMRREYIN